MNTARHRHPIASPAVAIVAVMFAAAYVLPYVDWSAAVPVGEAEAAAVVAPDAASSGGNPQRSMFQRYVAWLREAHAAAALHDHFAEPPKLF